MEFVFVLTGIACVGLVASVIVFAVHAQRREKDRRHAIYLWAMTNHWAYVPRPAVDWAARLPGKGRSGGVTLALSGPLWGRRVSVAEYHYKTTSSDADGGTTTHTHPYVVSVIHLDRPWPGLAVQPRSGLSKLGMAMFGTGTMIGHAEFDRQFTVHGDPGRLPPALVGAHVAGAVPHWSLWGTDLMTWHAGRIGDPATVPQFVAPLFPVAEMLTGPVNVTGSDAAGSLR
jgi:hypothetical protein